MLINTWQELVSVELQQAPTLKCTDVNKNFIFEQDGALLISTEMLHFWMRHFLDAGSEEEVLLPGSLDLRI
jgi:hypothetical protein